MQIVFGCAWKQQRETIKSFKNLNVRAERLMNIHQVLYSKLVSQQ